MKYAIRIYFWCHFLTSPDFLTQERAPSLRHEFSKGRFQACKSTSGSCPCVEKQAWLWDANRQQRCVLKPVTLFALASSNHHCIHWPRSMTCTVTCTCKFQHNSELRVICLLQKETLKLDLSAAFGFVFETEHEFRLSELSPMPGFWGNEGRCHSPLCHSQPFPHPSCDKMQRVPTYYPAWSWRTRLEIA